MLFVIATELLARTIRHSSNIEGVTILPNQEVKLSQYLDDTAVSLADVQSVSNLFELLFQFEKCSGFRINQSKSAMLWLASQLHRKDAILDLRLSQEPIQQHALGVHLSFEHVAAIKIKIIRNIRNFKNDPEHLVPKKLLLILKTKYSQNPANNTSF